MRTLTEILLDEMTCSHPIVDTDFDSVDDNELADYTPEAEEYVA